jgi:hypothetical protein
MDFFEPYDGPNGIAKGGVPTFAELSEAAFDESVMVRNVGGEGMAYRRAYADINRKVKEGFGIDLPNPKTDWNSFDPATGQARRGRLPERPLDAERQLTDWHQSRLAQLAQQNPALYSQLGLDQPLDERATTLMRGAVLRSADVGSRTQGWFTPTLASLWGGLQALPYDPLQVASLPFGGAGRTVAIRLGSAALAGGAVEAASYPLTTGQKERAGLQTGFGDFIGEVATGAAFGAGFQGAAEGLAAGVRAMRSNATPQMGRAADAEPQALRDPVAERGAAMVRDADDAMLAAKPATATPDDHARALSETMRYLDEPGAPAPIMPERLPEARPMLADKLDEPAGTSFNLFDKPVTRANIDPAKLEFEPERFQYKGGGDGRGVTDRLAGVERWDNMAAQAVVAFEFADGRMVVADGHQRTGLAQRLMAEGREKDLRIDAFVLRERDGWTADEAFAVATRRNLQQGTGDVTDTAVALQRLPGILDKSVARGSAHMRTAQGLARLDPDLLGMVRAGALSQEAGKVIGYKLPDPAQQRAAVDAIQRLGLKGEDTISGFIDEMKAAGVRSDVTFDLFGDQEIARSLAVEMAELKAKVGDLLKQNAKAFKRVNEAADVLEARENVILREVNASVARASGEARAFVQTLSIDPGPMRDIIMDGARRMAAGEKIAKVARDVANKIADVAEREGIEGLVPRAPATPAGIKAATVKIDDPVGPEVKARTDAMERALMRDLAPAEPGAEGKPQLLLDGVAPVRDVERLQLEADRPLRGGDAAPPEGGLFDDAARDQGGLFDMVPGLDDGRMVEGVAGGAAPRTRQQVLDDLARLDAENTLLDACVKG